MKKEEDEEEDKEMALASGDGVLQLEEVRRGFKQILGSDCVIDLEGSGSRRHSTVLDGSPPKRRRTFKSPASTARPNSWPVPAALAEVKAGKDILDELEPCDVESYVASAAALPHERPLHYVIALAQYPLAVKKFVELAAALPPDYSAADLLGVCHRTVEHAAGLNSDAAMHAHMQAMDSTAGYCKGLARVMEKLGVLRKLGAAPAQREGRWVKDAGGRRWQWYPRRTVELGKARPPIRYQLLHDASTLEALLRVCREGDCRQILRREMRTGADLVAHMQAFVRGLALWPPQLQVGPPKTERDKSYLHKLFVRKHLISEIRSSAWTQCAFLGLPLSVWGQWIPDEKGATKGVPRATTARELAAAMGGVPAELVSCYGCLFLPIRKMSPEARGHWTDPSRKPAMLAAARAFKQRFGTAPTPAWLTREVAGANADGAPGRTASSGTASAGDARQLRCACTGNCDTRCPARKAGGSCPNHAAANLASHVSRGHRPLCGACVCAHEGCHAPKRPRPAQKRWGPYCARHARLHPESPRALWQPSIAGDDV